MTPRARTILEQRWLAAGQPSDGWIWPAPTKAGHINHSSLKKQHVRALKLSDVRPFVLYSLRHTFLTRLGESGCDAWTLARVAGHSSVSISSRYVHPSEDAVLNAVERLGGHKIGHSAGSLVANGPGEIAVSASGAEGYGERGRTRTFDPCLKRALLYQLSYAPTIETTFGLLITYCTAANFANCCTSGSVALVVALGSADTWPSSLSAGGI